MEQLVVPTRKKKLKQHTLAHEVSSLLAPRGLHGDLPDDIRAQARVAGKAIATGISDCWQKARPESGGPIKLLDMFSGCGGMSTGFRAANSLGPIFDIRGAVDIDSVANRSYELNHGVTPLCEDVAALARSPKKLNRLLSDTGFDTAQMSVLIGCAPCQGFSSHRNEHGESDIRNSLFVDFARIASKVGPDAIVVENVPELLTDRYWPYVAKARQILEKAGYYVHVNVHNMAEFGVPQERFRALMLAMKRPFAPPKGFLSADQFRTVRDTISALPVVSAGQKHPVDPMHFSAGHKESTIETIRAVPKDGGNRPDHVGPACLQRAKERTGKAAYEDVYGRLAWDKPAITITAYARNPASGRFVHPEQDRGLTVREAALLQGFPRGYEIVGGLDERFRQIGNAVPPAFSAFLALHVVGELLAQPLPPADFDKGIVAPIGASFSRMIPSLKSKSRGKPINAIYA
ncbi:DNA cytosine methyltransferase [Burkholderia pseudomallei]|uniref:DNA cytosine methyltransferase n=1 Tax=Burkholderia pseudomallei TaxID=28450 RepID=UPI000A1CDB77|nr:DNA cytosine methyltransferase [Burkholderia pseudomallei]